MYKLDEFDLMKLNTCHNPSYLGYIIVQIERALIAAYYS